MKIKFMQDIIDCMRSKVFSKISSKKDDLYSKVVYKIKNSIPFNYPKTDEYLPNLIDGYYVETNNFINNYRFKKAKRCLNRLDINSLNWLYNNLTDEYSKEMLVNVLAYRILRSDNFRFPMYYSHVFGKNKFYENMIISDEVKSLCNGKLKLKKHNLASMGFPLTIWGGNVGFAIEFDMEQYNYRNIVDVEEGDYVIDGGACYGETALLFATKSKTGKIFSFEFIDENLDIFNDNLKINPNYATNINIVRKCLTDKSDEKFYLVESGPGSYITKEKEENGIEINSTSIDDFVNYNKIEKVDFIKLDIEGSEKMCLNGAIGTIKTFKPKLAICVYHKEEDLTVIPKFIKSIIPEYKLYLNHNAIGSYETVIYAKV